MFFIQIKASYQWIKEALTRFAQKITASFPRKK